MKKRGAIETLWVVISLLGALFLAYLVLDLSKACTSEGIFIKSMVAKELALQIDTLYTVQGDAFIINDDLYDFSIRIYDDNVEVYKDENELTKAKYSFTKSGTQEFDFKFDKPNRLFLAKADNEIVISEKKPW